jgi:hypothetical protein
MHKPVDRMAADPEEFNVQAGGSDRCPPSFLQRLLGEQEYGSSAVGHKYLAGFEV